jgi:hypothetical protein
MSGIVTQDLNQRVSADLESRHYLLGVMLPRVGPVPWPRLLSESVGIVVVLEIQLERALQTVEVLSSCL